ncbi:hypothetical protein ACH4PU_22920 [Streptomyces sp. NPDC021100]|uniref:hypothetical protein n=1 Tax=Streptomyces sp. NPDC021100 TaxID=3365114 RepID=UPI003797ABFD
MIPDEDSALEPTVRVFSPEGHVIPYEIVCWFMEHVAGQVEACRIAFEQGESAVVE